MFSFPQKNHWLEISHVSSVPVEFYSTGNLGNMDSGKVILVVRRVS